jgi:hypothetical protein
VAKRNGETAPRRCQAWARHRLWITHAGNVTSSMKHLVTPVIIVAITYVVIFLGLMFALWVTGGS